MSDDEATPEAEGDDASEAVHEPPASRFGALIGEGTHEVVLHTTVDDYLEVATAIHADGFDQLVDLTAVDYLTYGAPRRLPTGIEPERFEVVAQFIDHATRERVRLRVQVSGDAPVAPSLFDLWPGSEALEREVYDMFGIEFADHPDPSRILMPEDWIGHPLRKDYAIGSIPVQFKEVNA